MRFHEYDETTGEFAGRSIGGPDGWQPSPRAGRAFVLADSIDPQRQRVQIVDDGMGGEAVPVVVNRLPPRPDRVVEGAAWDWSDDAADWVLLPTLDGLRARRWAALREQRNNLEVSPLQVDGMLFDVDERAVARIGLALKEAELTPGWSEPWTLADDSISTITAPVLMRVLLALAARSRRLHRAGRALRQQLAEATTAADIEAVTWPEETTDADA